LDELKRLFDPNAFNAIVQGICNTAADRDTRFRLREQGLAQMRRYNETLVQDNRFRLLADNPFGVKWNAHLSLRKPLADFERLLLMAVSVKE